MIEFKNKKACYMTLIDGVLYVNNYNLKYTERIDMTNGKRDIVLRNTSACHNFYPFKVGNKLFGIGGQDNWKCEQSWKDHETFKEYKAYFLKRLGREYDRDAERWQKAQHRVIEECTSLDHSDGLYIFRSNDNGLTWDAIKRIIKTDHPGFIDGRRWGKGAEFDGHISVVEFKGEFIIYLRENTDRGIRRVQYARSKDLLTWGKFKTLELPYGNYQWYYPAVSCIKDVLGAGDILIGQFPICTEKESKIREFVSIDSKEWKFSKDLLTTRSNLSKEGPKPYYMPVQGTNKLYHENYFGLDKKNKVRIIKI